jgi:hypothetical protein
MSQIIPIYIPTYINNADYTPARVLPRLLFYNGLLDCQTYWIESGSATFGGVTFQQNAFPYFDNYNVVTGSFPTTDSDSLLFNNEGASYGEIPTNSLYTTYWEKYIQFLYNPKTRILNCSAIIPLADYFHMELNDIVNFRGNYWHLRAINDYSLKTGECNLQLLGPVIPDVFDTEPPIPPAQASSSVSWSYTESSQNGTFTIFDDASTLATLTANGGGNAQISQSHYVTASLVPVGYPSSGSVTMSINVNGGTTLAVTGSSNTTISASFLVASGSAYGITGSIIWNDTPPFTIDWLLIGGGASAGGGGSQTSGGGGAGRFVSSSTNITPSTIPITIGGGGVSRIYPSSAPGNDGGDSTIVISSITYIAPGGGGGGVGDTTGANRNGRPGGSGGGGASNGSSTTAGGAAVDGSPIVGFGNNGESRARNTNPVAGAGGGAGGTPTGLAWLDGITYCVGGSGTTNSNGSTAGSGGGGAKDLENSGAGAGGICIIRYPGTPVASGGSITQSGGYTYHTFTSSSNFVY